MLYKVCLIKYMSVLSQICKILIVLLAYLLKYCFSFTVMENIGQLCFCLHFTYFHDIICLGLIITGEFVIKSHVKVFFK